MKAEYVLRKLTDNAIEDLIQACKEEIAQSKHNGSSKSLFNARLKLSKAAYDFQVSSKRGEKPVTFVRPALAGAYVIDEQQMICNGAYGVIYNEIYEGLYNVVEVDGVPLVDLRKLFVIPNDTSIINLDFDIIKSDYKIYQATHKKTTKEQRALIKIKNTFIDVAYFINVIETLDNPKIYISDDNHKMLFVISDNGRAIFCPYNPNKVIDEQIVAVY